MKPKLTQYWTVRDDRFPCGSTFDSLEAAQRAYFRAAREGHRPSLWETTLLDWVDE